MNTIGWLYGKYTAVKYATCLLCLFGLYTGYEVSTQLQAKAHEQSQVLDELLHTRSQLAVIELRAKAIKEKTVAASQIKDVLSIQEVIRPVGLAGNEDLRVSRVERFKAISGKFDMGLSLICLQSSRTGQFLSAESQVTGLREQLLKVTSRSDLVFNSIELRGTGGDVQFKVETPCLLIKDDSL